MTNGSVNSRVVKLEVRQEVMESALSEMKSELKTLNKSVSELITLARMSKKFVGLVLVIGPSIGVVLARLIP